VTRFGGLEEVLGFSLAEVEADVSWYESRVHPDDLPLAWAGARAALESGGPGYSNVYRFLHRDGHYVTVADRSRILRDDTGRAVRVLGGVSYISERRRLEVERAVLLERERTARRIAEAATRARDEILSVVSHDLQSAISVMGMCATALAESLPSPSPSVGEILGAMHRSADWMHRLVRNLVEAASIDAGFLTLDRGAVDPRSVLQQTRELCLAKARERGVALEVQAPTGLPAADADADRLLQALTNLVSNALSYTERGGRVTLSADTDPLGIRFTVADTGVGIASEDLPHIFDRFWRKRRQSGQWGTGLGLSIVRGIVEAHGGEVWAESTPGEGSRFSFTIPTVS
jgi:signal transduction histidine kinase